MIDVAVIAIYLIGITAFGIWVGYRRETTSDQYFLASHSLNWFTVGAAVFTSNISTIHLVGLAAGGAKDGMVIGNFELMACTTLILLALVFAPFYINSGVKTLPQFLECRYCPQARTFMAVIGLLGALLIHIGISLFAAAKVFESFLGVPMVWTIIVLSLFTVIYTVLGGLKAVVMTENIQVVLLLFGATLVTVLGIFALPSVGVNDMASFRAALPPDHMKMLHPLVNSKGHLSEFSWLGILLGYPILGIWYWCADQTHVQRVLAARSLRDGQNGALFAGFLWSALPQPVRRQVKPGMEFLWLLPFLALCAWAAWQAGPAIESLCFTVKDSATGLPIADFREWWRQTTGETYDSRNSLVVGFVMGFAVIPIVFTIAEDALSNVPNSLVSGSLALGASRWQTVWSVVVPTAISGIVSAVMIGFGRAIGETMIVVMATGNTAVMDTNPFSGMRTLSANIAVELPEAAAGHTHYRALFLGACCLFLLTFVINTLAEVLRQRLRERYKVV